MHTPCVFYTTVAISNWACGCVGWYDYGATNLLLFYLGIDGVFGVFSQISAT